MERRLELLGGMAPPSEAPPAEAKHEGAPVVPPPAAAPGAGGKQALLVSRSAHLLVVFRVWQTLTCASRVFAAACRHESWQPKRKTSRSRRLHHRLRNLWTCYQGLTRQRRRKIHLLRLMIPTSFHRLLPRLLRRRCPLPLSIPFKTALWIKLSPLRLPWTPCSHRLLRLILLPLLLRFPRLLPLRLFLLRLLLRLPFSKI